MWSLYASVVKRRSPMEPLQPFLCVILSLATAERYFTWFLFWWICYWVTLENARLLQCLTGVNTSKTESSPEYVVLCCFHEEYKQDYDFTVKFQVRYASNKPESRLWAAPSQLMSESGKYQEECITRFFFTFPRVKLELETMQELFVIYMSCIYLILLCCIDQFHKILDPRKFTILKLSM